MLGRHKGRLAKLLHDTDKYLAWLDTAFLFMYLLNVIGTHPHTCGYYEPSSYNRGIYTCRYSGQLVDHLQKGKKRLKVGMTSFSSNRRLIFVK